MLLFWFLDEIEVNDDDEIEEDDPASAELRFVPDDKSICKYTHKTKCL